jgi:hypothetical protein
VEVKVVGSTIYPFRKTHFCIGRMIPNRVVKNRCAYEIIHLSENLFLHGFAITTYLENDKIIAINLYGEHPNCDLNTNTFCWPENKQGLELNQDTLNIMLANFHTYYLDSAHFIPPEKELRYKKLDSISIQLTRGEV